MWWGGFSEILAHNTKYGLLTVLIPMWWGGFSEILAHNTKYGLLRVLIPMWWGGFSEFFFILLTTSHSSLNPHVVGRFFRGRTDMNTYQVKYGLNPHVVGRFFRGKSAWNTTKIAES